MCRRHPGDDLISNAVAAHDVEGKISDDELFSLVMVTVLGAVPTTADMISATVFNLLANPAQLEAVRSDPALAAGAVEEALRYDPPVHTTIRFSTEDCEIGGVRIAARSPVYVVMGAANDPAQFPDPDRFDFARNPNDHLSFEFTSVSAPRRRGFRAASPLICCSSAFRACGWPTPAGSRSSKAAAWRAV